MSVALTWRAPFSQRTPAKHATQHEKSRPAVAQLGFALYRCACLFTASTAQRRESSGCIDGSSVKESLRHVWSTFRARVQWLPSALLGGQCFARPVTDPQSRHVSFQWGFLLSLFSCHTPLANRKRSPASTCFGPLVRVGSHTCASLRVTLFVHDLADLGFRSPNHSDRP